MDEEQVKKFTEKLSKSIKELEKDKTKIENLERLKEVAQRYDGGDKIITFQEIADIVKKEREEKGDELKMLTGFEKFDGILKGFRLEQLVVLSGVTGNGKTSFAMELSERLKEFNPLWFPFEESAYELVRKCLERGYEPPNAFTPKYLKEENIEWVKMKIIEGIAKYNTKIIFIDHLEYLVPKGYDEVRDTSQVMRQLKSLAKEFNIVIVLLAHVKKVKIDTSPSTEDLKGSTSITQQADTVIIVWRETIKEGKQIVSTNNTNISIQKNRRFGPTGNVKMVFNDGRFIEEEWVDSDNKALQDFKDF